MQSTSYLSGQAHPYLQQSPFWVYVIRCHTPDRFHVGMTTDLPRRIAEHRRRRSGSPSTARYGVKAVTEIFPVNTKGEALSLERATVLRYLTEGRCIATGGGIGEQEAIRARDEHNLLKAGLNLRRKRSVWKRRRRVRGRQRNGKRSTTLPSAAT